MDITRETVLSVVEELQPVGMTEVARYMGAEVPPVRKVLGSARKSGLLHMDIVDGLARFTVTEKWQGQQFKKLHRTAQAPEPTPMPTEPPPVLATLVNNIITGSTEAVHRPPTLYGVIVEGVCTVTSDQDALFDLAARAGVSELTVYEMVPTATIRTTPVWESL